MSRLLTALLLYRSGYVVGKYISIENKIAKNKELYYKALEECQEGWHENKEDVTPFIKYMLRVILAAYRDFEERVELWPSIGVKSVELALKQLVDDGVLLTKGSGRATFYVRSDSE